MFQTTNQNVFVGHTGHTLDRLKFWLPTHAIYQQLQEDLDELRCDARGKSSDLRGGLPSLRAWNTQSRAMIIQVSTPTKNYTTWRRISAQLVSG